MKKIFWFILCLLVACMLMLNQSCTKDYLIPLEFEIPDSVSFSNDIIPIFDESCNSSGCHNTGGIAPDLTPSNAFFQLWTFGYVDTTNPSSSILYLRMNSTSNPMPPVGKLPEDKIQFVLAWIEQGALDN